MVSEFLVILRTKGRESSLWNGGSTRLPMLLFGLLLLVELSRKAVGLGEYSSALGFSFLKEEFDLSFSQTFLRSPFSTEDFLGVFFRKASPVLLAAFIQRILITADHVTVKAKSKTESVVECSQCSGAVA
jgi:hypothetical protein